MKVLETVDTWQAKVESSPAILEATDTFYEKAHSLITAPQAKKAFDIGTEDPRLRDRYGMNSLGQGCLLARRLIEAGVRFVTVTDGGWDTHQNNFVSLKTRLLPGSTPPWPACFRTSPTAACSTRRWSSTLSDFGRTPKINPSAGRDHWSTASVAMLAGGGIRPGLAVGQTNALGRAADRGALSHRGPGGDPLSTAWASPSTPPTTHPTAGRSRSTTKAG